MYFPGLADLLRAARKQPSPAECCEPGHGRARLPLPAAGRRVEAQERRPRSGGAFQCSRASQTSGEPRGGTRGRFCNRKRKRPAPASGARAAVGRQLLPLCPAARVMAATALPPLPPQFKSIQHHLRTAQELDKREPVVAYYCRLYAMQTGMKIDSKTPECRKFLSKLMDQLEAMKKQFGDNEAITQEIVGSAHVENYALKMFLYADNEDRAGQFHKNMIKSFYTASLLIDVLTVFGELSEENAQHRKYARWKAAYIHNCLKNGETPQPGPIGMEGESFDVEREEAGSSSLHSGTTQPAAASTYEANNIPTSNYTGIHIPPGAHAPANTPAEVPHNTGVTSNTIQPAPQNIPLVDPSLYSAQSAGEVRLTPEDFARAQKYCKYAGSALQYEDVSTAVQNLQKALKLLITGRE